MILQFNHVMSMFLVTLTFTCHCQFSSAQINQFPNSPCPNIFQYVRKGNTNFGIITVNDFGYGTTTLAVELAQRGYMELKSAGRLTLNFKQDKIYTYLDEGRPFTFRLDFPLQTVIPEITSITVNDVQICNGQPPIESPRTDMRLEYSLSAYSSTSNSSPIPASRSNNADYPYRSNSRQGSTSDGSLPDFLKYSPSHARQMATIPSRQSFTQQTSPTPSFTQTSTGSDLPAFLRLTRPSFQPMPSNLPSSLNQPSRMQPPLSITRTQPSNTEQTRPRNMFLDGITPAIDSYRPVGSYGTRNPPPTFAPPITPPLVTKPDTSIVPAPMTPIFTFPTTMDSTSSPLPKINFKNDEPNIPAPSTESVTASTDGATFDYINSVCGEENEDKGFTNLNVGGTPIYKFRFPWIVALFKRIDDDDFEFRCGGSLISTRTVVSAAHCFFVGSAAIKPEELVVSMGLHNLTERLDARNSNAKNVIVHPDYRPLQNHFDADVAIIRLEASVTFTSAVRPICIWEGNKDQREIVGMPGMIVGWGSDGRQKSTVVPTLVKAFVAEETTCLKSNVKFISMTSSRTLCAGNKDGSGPCVGDSGNGLMLRNRNRWMLRGTVSAAQSAPLGQCILNEYAIYSDIAMFIDWINSNMLL